MLDNNSILNIFYLYRPPIFDGDESNTDRIKGGKRWNRERWWYKLARVCQRWRGLLLGSASYLGICLVCTWGTPVADMLAHSPSLPLVIDYEDDSEDWHITAEEEERISLALEQRDRVCRVRLRMPVPIMQKLIMAFDEEYPVLEYLIMEPPDAKNSTDLVLPERLQAPHLRHLLLLRFAIPIGSRLLTTTVGLITLALAVGRQCTFFQPDILLQWLSFMPQLEKLLIVFVFPITNSYVEGQLTQAPTMTDVTLPNLRWFEFQGASAYVEAIVHRITAPRLEKLFFQLYEQPTFCAPRLLQFIKTTENLMFDSATIEFSWDRVFVGVHLCEEVEAYALSMILNGSLLDWQVHRMAQISNSLSQIFSTVEHLTLEHEASSEERDEPEVDPTQWRKLLRSFSNVKTLRVGARLVKELSRCLRLDDGEHPLEALPKLQELTYSGSDYAGDAFTSFVDARQDAGHPVNMQWSSSPSRSSSPGFSELSLAVIAPWF
jgi:hypothetical protein